MKGIILSGGLGTRLRPITTAVNKHLLPIYDRPMIYWSIKTLKEAGCTDILVVVGSQSTGQIIQSLGDGKQFGLNSLYFVYQSNPAGGIADALSLGKSWVAGDRFCLMLGDNLIHREPNSTTDLAKVFETFNKSTDLSFKGQIFLVPVENPSAFGIAEIDPKTKTISKLVEKPKNPTSNLAVIGLYLYDSVVFDYIEQQEPSARGELEITDLNKALWERGQLRYQNLEGYYWHDTGSVEAMIEASIYTRQLLLQRSHEKMMTQQS